MSKKTIAFVSFNLTSGGAERVLTNLANELSDRFTVRIITIEDCKSFYDLNEKVEIISCGLDLRKVNFTASKYLKYYSTTKILSNILNKIKAELIIGFTTTVNIFTIIASIRTGIPCIISERNNPIHDPPNLLWKTLRDILYKKSNYLVVQTAANKAFFSKIMSGKNIKILPNPVSQVFSQLRKLPIRATKSQVILSVGRLDENKSQDLLIRAFAKTDNEGWKVQLVGDGEKKDDFQKLVVELGLQKKVNFLGNQKNVASFYENAEIFVFCSKSEGFPNALMEAQYFGLPCISTACPHGPSEIITNGENGYLIDVDNENQLISSLNKLINNKLQRKKFSDEAIKRSKKYEMSEVIKQWENTITSLI